MKIEKILNNNAIVVNNNNQEMVVMGKGIAFKKKVGDYVEENNINKTYYLTNPDLNTKLIQLLINVDYEVTNIAKKIIEEINLEMDNKVSETIYINLIDHFQSTIERYKKGIRLPNPLTMDIKKFYPVEYRLAKNAIALINNEFNIDLDENEIGFVTLHIVDSTVNTTQNELSYKITTLIKDIVNLVRRYFQLDFNEDSIYYYRFISHLRFFAQRVLTNSKVSSKTNVDELLNIIKIKYQKSYECSLLIKEYIYNQHKHTVKNDELLYLTIHIQRILDEYFENLGGQNG